MLTTSRQGQCDAQQIKNRGADTGMAEQLQNPRLEVSY